MRSVTDITTMLGVVNRNSSEVVASGTGLQLLNAVYRRIVMQYPWPEFRKQDTSLTTVADQSPYTWPSDFIPLNIVLVEMQDGDDADKYKQIHLPPDENTWNTVYVQPSASAPSHYRRSKSGTLDRIEFAPPPKYTGKTIRITCITEPLELNGSDSKTEFMQSAADDALVYTVAAELLEVDGDLGFADRQLAKAKFIFDSLFGNETTQE